MWITRLLFERLVRTDGGKDAEIARLRATVAVLEANCQWLQDHVNAIRVERGVLFERVTGLRFPIEQIHDTPRPTEALKEIAARLPVSGLPLPAPNPNLVGTPATEAAPFRDVNPGVFEDMGDLSARKVGAAHADDGQVVYQE
jgi:hypothetical protein